MNDDRVPSKEGVMMKMKTGLLIAALAVGWEAPPRRKRSIGKGG